MHLNKFFLIVSDVSQIQGKIGQHTFLQKNGIKENKNIKSYINITIRIIGSDFNHVRTLKSCIKVFLILF